VVTGSTAASEASASVEAPVFFLLAATADGMANMAEENGEEETPDGDEPGDEVGDGDGDGDGDGEVEAKSDEAAAADDEADD